MNIKSASIIMAATMLSAMAGSKGQFKPYRDPHYSRNGTFVPRKNSAVKKRNQRRKRKK